MLLQPVYGAYNLPIDLSVQKPVTHEELGNNIIYKNEQEDI